MKVVRGSRGEGGGQVVRTAVSLAAALRFPVRVEGVRANRDPPGLKTQHLVSVRALAHLTQGVLEGDALGSTSLSFAPGLAMGGEYHFPIPTAGSVTILLQTLMPALAASRQVYALELEGGTDVPWSPSWAYFANVHGPALREMGLGVEGELFSRGYFPAGGGRARVRVDASAFHDASFVERAPVARVRGVAHSNGLPKHVVQRAAEAARDELLAAGYSAEVEVEHHRGPGAGMGVTLWTEGAGVPLGSDAVGRKGKPAEEVGREAARGLVADLEGRCGVDVHQADMLPPLLALAGGGRYTVRGMTGHLETNLALVEELTGVPCRWRQSARGIEVRIGRQE